MTIGTWIKQAGRDAGKGDGGLLEDAPIANVEYLALDTTPSAVTATSVELAGSAFSTPPVIGDWVCAPDTSPFIQLPVELQPALVELTVARCLRAQGNLAEADAHAAAAQMETNIGIGALTPRVETADRKIVGGAAWRRRGYLRTF